MSPQFWDKSLRNFSSGLSIPSHFLGTHIDSWITYVIVDKSTQIHR